MLGFTKSSTRSILKFPTKIKYRLKRPLSTPHHYAAIAAEAAAILFHCGDYHSGSSPLRYMGLL